MDWTFWLNGAGGVATAAGPVEIAEQKWQRPVAVAALASALGTTVAGTNQFAGRV